MKICMLTDAWKPIWGGGQEHIFQVSKILREEYGCEVEIIAPTLINKNFDFHNLFHRIWFAFWVLKFLLTSNYDIYHSHSFSTSAFLPLVKLRDKKTAFTVHGAGVSLVGGGLINKLGVSKLLMFLVLRVWPYDFRFSASPIPGFITVGNGVKVAEFDAVQAKKNPEKFRIFWLGRKYDPVKGVKYLEEAVKRINDPKIELDLADGVYGKEKIKRFKQADLFVLPSLSEGLPLTLLEAMAAKLPVVATDVGSCRKIVEESGSGKIIPPGDTNKLANSIKQIIQLNRARRDEMGNRGNNFVRKNYSWVGVADRIYQAYSKP